MQHLRSSSSNRYMRETTVAKEEQWRDLETKLRGLSYPGGGVAIDPQTAIGNWPSDGRMFGRRTPCVS